MRPATPDDDKETVRFDAEFAKVIRAATLPLGPPDSGARRPRSG
jgi:hypothetical protein